MGVFHFFKIVQMVPNRATHDICDALRDIVPFVQFKKREKTPMEECYFY